MARETAIHTTAQVDSAAVLGEGVSIGPFSIVGPNVKIGNRVRIGPHVIVHGHTDIGEECEIHPFACVGGPPQDMKFQGERTRLVIGERNRIREYATFHPGTAGGGGITVVGSDGLFMIGSHVAHDCRIGDRVIMANQASLGGHVIIEGQVILGAFVGIHQFCRVGRLAMVAAGTMVVKDVAPFCMVHRDRARLVGLNTVGLKRSKLSDDTITDIRHAYRILFRSKRRLEEALKRATEKIPDSDEVQHLVEFIQASERGVCR